MRKILLLSLLSACVAASAQAPLTLARTLVLTGVSSRFDHLAVDLAHQHLFVAATTHKSVEVIDLKDGKTIQSIAGLGKPHGLAWAADTQKLYVADGALKQLRVYQGSPLTLAASLPLSEDADDMAYDANDHLLFVGHGTGEAAAPGLIAVVDTETFTLVKNLPVSAHPEALEYDANAHQVFVNIADAAEVVVVDARAKSITKTWKLNAVSGNIPLAFDAKRNALYIASRKPATLLAVNAANGAELQKIPSVAGVDDLFFDAAANRVYAIGGGGEVQSAAVDAAGSLHALGNLSTASGAKTGLLVPELHELFVAVPMDAPRASEIRVYNTDNASSASSTTNTNSATNTSKQ